MADPSLARLIAILTRRIAELESAAFSDFTGLSLRQVVYLETVGELGNPTPTELAARLKLSKPSVTAAVDRLAQEGYIEKVRSDADRRSFHLHLTGKGSQLAAAHAQVHAHIASLLAQGLSDAERQELERLLNKITGTLAADLTGFQNL